MILQKIDIELISFICHNRHLISYHLNLWCYCTTMIKRLSKMIFKLTPSSPLKGNRSIWRCINHYSICLLSTLTPWNHWLLAAFSLDIRFHRNLQNVLRLVDSFISTLHRLVPIRVTMRSHESEKTCCFDHEITYTMYIEYIGRYINVHRVSRKISFTGLSIFGGHDTANEQTHGSLGQ